MSTRRFHSKTRSGCVQCKARKQKCDEAKPVCKNCARRQITCSLTSETSTLIVVKSQYTSKPLSSKISINAPSANCITLEHRRPHGEEMSLAKTYSLKGAENDMLRLMHHYAISTCFIVADSSLTPLWRDVIPALAFEYDFLLSGLLAVTSLHLSLLNPSTTNTSSAIRYHSQALVQIRPHLTCVSPDNVAGLFAFSCLIPLYSFGIHQTQPSGLDPIGEIFEVFSLMRGIGTIVINGMQWLEQGPFAGYRLPTPSNSEMELVPQIEAALRKVFDRNLNSTTDPAIRAAYMGAIGLLRQTFVLAAENPGAKMPMLPFPIMIPPKFMEKLRDREPLALVIMAYYGVALYWLRDNIWLRGWGKEIVDAVNNAVGPEWSVCLEFATKEVGGSDIVG